MSRGISAGRLSLDRMREARRLLADYPFKERQRLAQGLDPRRLARFHAAGIEAGIRAGAPHWMASDRNGKPLAAAGLRDDAWHSSVYGLRMGKVQPWLTGRGAEGGDRLLERIERRARKEGYEHLSARVDGEDYASLHQFERAGWLLVDISLKFTLTLKGLRRVTVSAGTHGWRVGEAREEDAAWIERLGSTTHGGTHFLNDPALPESKTRALFARWLRRSIDGMAWRVDTLRDPAGTGRGFVTYLRARAFAEKVGRDPLILDFVLIDPQWRGGGLGPWFLRRSLARAMKAEPFDYCELRTSAHNLAAVGSYEKLGFVCCASDFVLHKAL